jgi:hypothetical protein
VALVDVEIASQFHRECIVAVAASLDAMNGV